MASSINTINVGGVDKEIEDSFARTRLDEIIGGDAPSAAEVADARVGYDEVDYGTLGAAIRSQFAKTIFDHKRDTNLTTCDAAEDNSIYFITSSGGQSSTPDFPIIGQAGWLITLAYNNDFKFQIACPFRDQDSMYIRARMLTGWQQTWRTITIDQLDEKTIKLNENLIGGYCLHDIRYPIPTAFGISDEGDQATIVYDYNKGMYKIEGMLTNKRAVNTLVKDYDLIGLIPGKTYNMMIRLEEDHETDSVGGFFGEIYIKRNSSSAHWESLSTLTPYSLSSVIIPSDAVGILARFNLDPGYHNTYAAIECVDEDMFTPKMANFNILNKCFTNYIHIPDSLRPFSCDNLTRAGVYFNSISGGETTFSDFPFNDAGWIINYSTGLNGLDVQMAVSYSGPSVKMRIHQLNGWTSWVYIGDGGTVYNVTQEINRDTISNTYNITTTPTITTDSNGWLQAVDTDTSDESGKTDMTGAIMSMLNSTGYCHLGPGIFYVSGNIDMPAGSIIEGCGKKTIIRLLQSVSSGYILRLKEYSTAKNICFSGGYSALDVESADIGGRKGIIYIGNANGQDPGITPAGTRSCQITGCFFENLDSGIYGYNSGGGIQQGLIVDSCHIQYCKVGINLDYYVEYSTFTGVVTFQCHFACINNGGNNKFVNCIFHGIVGFLMDNSAGDKPNNSHGSCVCCTFNHIHNFGPTRPSNVGNGIGIKVIGNQNGFIFSGCQLWYGNVEVTNSIGIVFDNNFFGNDSIAITATGANPVFFLNNVFFSQPSLNVSSNSVFVNNYTKAGAVVTA